MHCKTSTVVPFKFWNVKEISFQIIFQTYSVQVEYVKGDFQCRNAYKLKQHNLHFTEDILKFIVVNEIVVFWYQLNLLFLIDNTTELSYLMVWCRTDDNLLFQSTMAEFAKVCMSQIASMCLINLCFNSHNNTNSPRKHNADYTTMFYGRLFRLTHV